MAERDSQAELIDELRSDQRRRWLAGDRVPTEEYLKQHHEVFNDEEVLLDFIYGEYCLREELGDILHFDEYLLRFPNLSDQLNRLFEVHRALDETKDSAPSRHQVIGRYKILQEIGEGGFGVVYMAEQEEPVRRRVALKVIKLGMDTMSGIARFEAERQALALMDHSNIAKVLDAATLPLKQRRNSPIPISTGR